MKCASVTVSALSFCFLIACHVGNGWHNPEAVEEAERLHLKDFENWYQREPTSLPLMFDHSKIIPPEGNNTKSLVLTLYGYSERNATKISKLKTPFTQLASAKFQDPDKANGLLDILQLDLKCGFSEAAECNRYDMGYLHLGPEKDEIPKNFTVKLGQISQIIPLGWFLEKNFKSSENKEWPVGKCNAWFSVEEKDTELKELIAKVSCPVTLEAASNDPSWFVKANYLAGFHTDDWKPGNNSAEPKQTCFYSAIEDFAKSPLPAAPASMCCYRYSDGALLMKEFMNSTNLRLHGSSVLRSHPFGLDDHIEHYKPGQVPYLSHWYNDMLPYLHCCYWHKGHLCAQMYMKLRPPPKIVRKQTDHKYAYVAESLVQPIDGKPAIFCPTAGEYWLLRTDHVEVQIRNYVVSTYKEKDFGKDWKLTWKSNHSQFETSHSKAVFTTAVAMRSKETKIVESKILELVCPEGELRSYVQANSVDRANPGTTVYEGIRGRALGTHLLVGDAIPVGKSKRYSFLVKHSLGRLGMYAYVVEPNEEFMNLVISISSSLLSGNRTAMGLAVGSTCAEAKIDDAGDRLFSSLCDNCDDFDKYKNGRPLYYEDIDKIESAPASSEMNAACGSDKYCAFMLWATNFKPYFDSISMSKKNEIDVLIKRTENDYEACQKPPIVGLYVGPDQQFKEGSEIKLKCMSPFKASKESAVAKCVKNGGSLEFDSAKDFACTEDVQIVQEEKAAEKVAEQYAKDNYKSPDAKAAKYARRIAPENSHLMVFCISLALTRSATVI